MYDMKRLGSGTDKRTHTRPGEASNLGPSLSIVGSWHRRSQKRRDKQKINRGLTLPEALPAPSAEIEDTRQLGVDRQPLAQTTPRHIATNLGKSACRRARYRIVMYFER